MPLNKKERETFLDALIASDLVIDETSRIILCRDIDFPRPSYINYPEVEKFCKRLVIDLEDRKRAESLAELARLLEEDRKGTKYTSELKKIRRELENDLEQPDEVSRTAFIAQVREIQEEIAKGPQDGWKFVTKAELDAIDLSDESSVTDGLINFFNGAPPRWSEIVTKKIHKRKKVAEIVKSIEKHRSTVTPQIHLLLDAGGEGKSTMMMQAVYELLQNEEAVINVMLRDEFELGKLTTDFFKKRPKSGENWLIVADEASDIAKDIIGICQWLYSQNYRGYQFLLVSRDSDWDTAGLSKGNIQGVSIESYGTGGVDKDDARDIVASWHQYKKRGMGALYGKGIPEGAAELFKKAHESAGHKEGSLFGAIFDLRIEGQLDAHIYELISKLEKDKDGKKRVVYSDLELLDVFAYIIALHAVDFRFVNQRILARALSLPNPKYSEERNETITRVIFPHLGREAAIATHENLVLSRHQAIARKAKEHLEATGLDFSGRILDLVKAAMEIYVDSKRAGTEKDMIVNHKEWRFHLAERFEVPNLKLAIQIMEVVCKTAYYQDPFTVRKLTSLLRKDKRAEEATWIYWEKSQRMYKDRAFYHEWSTVEGFAGHLHSAIQVGAISIADGIKESDSFNLRMKLCLTNLMEVFLKMPKIDAYANAALACSALTQYLDLNRQEDYRLIDTYQKAIRNGYKKDIPTTTLIDEIIVGIKKAEQQSTVSLPDWLEREEKIRIDELRFEVFKQKFAKIENDKKKS